MVQCKEEIEWLDIWITGANQSHLPRVLLIGDSITRAYFPHVEKLLANRYLCARIASSRSVCDAGFLKELRLVLDEYSFSAIHFNNGLHGWDYSETIYASDLRISLAFLQQQTPHLIWAQTTPVRTENNLQEFGALNARVLERNRLAHDIAVETSVSVNDLYAAALPYPNYYALDGVHFNEEGCSALAQQVANSFS
jgi:hypothetical protein